MLETVTAVEPDAIQVRLDGVGQNTARLISIPDRSYQSFDHGFATTIHKSQGATVDRAFVIASTTMDRHLTYVAMTRHWHAVGLYAGRDELQDLNALAASLGRSGAKETVLDCTNAFAARRGWRRAFLSGVRSSWGHATPGWGIPGFQSAGGSLRRYWGARSLARRSAAL